MQEKQQYLAEFLNLSCIFSTYCIFFFFFFTNMCFRSNSDLQALCSNTAISLEVMDFCSNCCCFRLKSLSFIERSKDAKPVLMKPDVNCKTVGDWQTGRFTDSRSYHIHICMLLNSCISLHYQEGCASTALYVDE